MFPFSFRRSFKTLPLSVVSFATFSLTIILITSESECSNRFREMEQEILKDILGKNYDNRIRPGGNNQNGDDIDGPCKVDVNIMIRSISSIDDVKMEYALQITFREKWRDSRLDYSNHPYNGTIKQIVLTEPNKIWRPDIFFKNEKRGHFHEIITPNVLLRILRDGTILYSIRISLVLLCPMNLKYFPLDVQHCKISMASYGYTVKDLIFRWKKGNPLEVNMTKIYLPRFDLRNYEAVKCDSNTTTGAYSCVEGIFYFKREFSYYLFLIYLPCCMLVIVSWVSFWIDANSTAARVLLGITSLLTMSRQISSINSTLPPVSYIKAVDVWTGCCLIFVFSALIEFAVVNYVSRADATKMGMRRRRPTMIGASRKYDSGKDSGIDSSDIEDATGYAKSLGNGIKLPRKRVKKPMFTAWWNSRFATRSKKIDVFSRIVFPLLFAVFNAFYWTKYLFRDELYDE